MNTKDLQDMRAHVVEGVVTYLPKANRLGANVEKKLARIIRTATGMWDKGVFRVYVNPVHGAEEGEVYGISIVFDRS